MFGSDERYCCADLLGGRAATKWQRLEQVFPVVRAAGAIKGLFFHETNQPLGCHRAWADRDNTNPIPRADAAERLGKRRQGSIARDPTDIFRIVRIGRVADNIDDNAALALLHERVKGAAHIDTAEDLEVPRFAPGRLVDTEQRAARNRTRIV